MKTISRYFVQMAFLLWREQYYGWYSIRGEKDDALKWDVQLGRHGKRPYFFFLCFRRAFFLLP